MSPSIDHLSSACIDLKVVSPSVGIHSDITFTAISVYTTVHELKQRVSDSVPSRPSPSIQRLVFSGRILDDNTDLNTALNYRSNPSPASSYTVHLVLSDPVEKVTSPTPVGSRYRARTSPNAPASPFHPPSPTPAQSVLTPTPTIPLTAIDVTDSIAPDLQHVPITPAGEQVSSSQPLTDIHNMGFAPAVSDVPPNSNRPVDELLRPSPESTPADSDLFSLPSQSLDHRSWLVVSEDGTPRAMLMGGGKSKAETEKMSTSDNSNTEPQNVYIPSTLAIRERLWAQRRAAIARDRGEPHSENTPPQDNIWNILHSNPDWLDQFGAPRTNRSRNLPNGYGLQSSSSVGIPSSVRTRPSAHTGSGPSSSIHASLEALRRRTHLPAPSRLPQVGRRIAYAVGGNGVPPRTAAPVVAPPPAAAPAPAAQRAGLRVFHFRFSFNHVWDVLRLVVLWYFFSSPLIGLIKDFHRFIWPVIAIGVVWMFFYCGVLGDGPNRVYRDVQHVIYGPPPVRPYTYIFRSRNRANEQPIGLLKGGWMMIQSIALTIVICFGCVFTSVGAEMVRTQTAYRDLSSRQRGGRGRRILDPLVE